MSNENELNIFTGEHKEFLNEFYQTIRKYVSLSFDEIMYLIKCNPNNYFTDNYTQDEVGFLILLNKCLYEYMISFFALVEAKLPVAAFNSLRSGLECARLCRLYMLDSNFRKEYTHNDSSPVGDSKDYKFTQGNIIKMLTKRGYVDINKVNKADIDLSKLEGEVFTYQYVKDSDLSRLHSELSKWSHALNVNLLFLTMTDKGGISMTIDESYYNIYMEHSIQKYTEGCMLILQTHLALLNYERRECLKTVEEKIDKLFEQYIELFYKNNS